MNAVPSAGGYVLSLKLAFTIVFPVTTLLYCHIKTTCFGSCGTDTLGCWLLSTSVCVCMPPLVCACVDSGEFVFPCKQWHFRWT